MSPTRYHRLFSSRISSTGAPRRDSSISSGTCELADGGAVLLKAAERQYGLIDGFAECLVDDRQPGKVRHTLADLLGQRIFGIACGHPDGYWGPPR